MNVMVRGRIRNFRTVDFDAGDNAVVLIEQRLLPHRFHRVWMRDHEETASAIRDMVVRGAGAIGATAAYGLAQGARAFLGRGFRAFERHLDRVHEVLANARPTAVDPVNALGEVRRAMAEGRTISERQELALEAARRFADRNVDECRAIGRLGSHLIQNGMTVLTHCNAGWLAFVDVGTATAPLYQAREEGRDFTVLCDETRPRCQGATLTAWELAQQGIRHAVIADNAAGALMQQGHVDLVIVGTDRVLARTGHVVNKIGTYTKAVLAHRHGVPFYVAAPESTLDWQTGKWRDIPIEERSPDEVLGAWGAGPAGRSRYVRIANPGSPALNPGFDVTPPELVTGIITPIGILKPSELRRTRNRFGRP